jgi:hypothetical protein
MCNVSAESRAIAQVVSRRLPTAAARVRTRSGNVGFVVAKVALGQVFYEYFGFPCQFSFYQLLRNHPHLIIRGWDNRPVSCRRTKWTQSQLPPQETKKRSPWATLHCGAGNKLLRAAYCADLSGEVNNV